MAEQGGRSDEPADSPTTSKAAGNADEPPMTPGASRRLPTTQPQRAVLACLLYLLVTSAGLVLFRQMFGGGMAVIFAIAFAALLTVPLALLAPVPRRAPLAPEDPRPVLLRGPRKTKQ